MKDVIDNDYRPIFQRYRKFRSMYDGQFLARAHIVTMHCYINDAGIDIGLPDLANENRDSTRDLYAARRDPGEHYAFKVRVSLDDLVRYARSEEHTSELQSPYD